jgi:hypothetical protein
MERFRRSSGIDSVVTAADGAGPEEETSSLRE